MARQEHRREDLITDASALVDRVELRGADLAEPIVAGFRENGALSLFFGEDPVFQFNAAGELRRAYQDGALYKARHGKLVRLVRHRAAGEVQLRSTEVTVTEQQSMLEDIAERLQRLTQALEAEQIWTQREVTASGQAVADRLLSWLSSRATTIQVAAAWHV